MNPNQQEPENILEKIPPGIDKFEERIIFLAKALATGASKDKWTPVISVLHTLNGNEQWNTPGQGDYAENFAAYFQEYWENMQPRMSFLEAYGYVRLNTKLDDPHSSYILTPKALKLLDIPLETPKIFISYKRGEGTALALFVFAKLQLRGIENPYLDLRLRDGDNWKKELEEAISNVNTFIGILTPESLDSDFILEEIAWASRNPEMKFIWIKRNDWELNYPDKSLKDIVVDAPDKKVKDLIEEIHWTEITDKSAKQYNATMDVMLRSLGYAPR